MTIEIKDRSDHQHPHPYPALANVLGRVEADAVNTLYHYVRPEGDWVLVRGQLDQLDRAFAQLEAFIQEKYDGYSWSKR